MIRRPPSLSRTYTLFPHPTLFRSAGGLAVLERQIGATRSQHENLRTAFLVDENLTRARFLGLRHQEIDDDRLAAPGRANDQRVANVALVKAEEVGAACARLHQRDRVPPMVPRGEASGIGMEGRERRERSEEHTSELQSLMRISYAV